MTALDDTFQWGHLDGTTEGLGADLRERLVLRHVRAVVEDRVVDDATIVCQGGTIVSVVERGPGTPDAIDGRGALCIPGLVDTHSDGLEKEVRPRPTSRFTEDFALRNFEGRLRAAAITTVFHGVGFEERPEIGRTVDAAERSCAAILDRRRTEQVPVDHRVLFRMEARTPRGIEDAEAHFTDPVRSTSTGAQPKPLVSFEDHSPGQGQFRDLERFAASIPAEKIPDGSTREAFVAERLAAAEEARHHRERTLARLVEHARAGRIRLLAHDCETPDDVTEAHESWAAEIAEFPLTLDGARRARDLGMGTVMGAPNVLLGGSHSGNLSAEEAVRAGVCTALASDYLPATLLAAPFALARHGAADLPTAVSLVTSGPASIAGLEDRGRLAPGCRSDLALVAIDGRWPRVIRAWRADPELGIVSA